MTTKRDQAAGQHQSQLEVAPRRLTFAEWSAEGERRFGADRRQWRFVCPSCGHVASVAEWMGAGAPEGAVAFSCVGRYLPTCSEMCVRPGPCNYAGGGLIGLNPWTVEDQDGKAHDLFAFAEVTP